MRVISYVLSLALFTLVSAAPAPAPPQPALFAKDPLSLHKRAAAPDPPIGRTPIAMADVEIPQYAGEPPEDACEALCGMTKVEGARTEREALCSVDGLRATLECATCIDLTWPDTSYDDSAMGEYERIVEACQDGPQRAFRRNAF